MPTCWSRLTNEERSVEEAVGTSDGRVIRTFGEVPLCNDWMAESLYEQSSRDVMRCLVGQMRVIFVS
jgi:hypothetical protein